MKKIDLGQTISILANLGVIAGIVFLGFELEQNNELMEAEARFNRLSLQTDTQTIIAQNPRLAEIMAKYNDGLELTTAERIQWRALYGRSFSNMNWTYLEAPESDWPKANWRAMMARSEVVDFWGEYKANLDEEFVSYMQRDIIGE